MSSLSVDYILTLVLAILLAVKYILFDPDEDETAMTTVATVTTSTTSRAKIGPSVVVTSCFGDGHLEQIDEVADEALHCEMADDITPTGPSLAAGISHDFVRPVKKLSGGMLAWLSGMRYRLP